MINIKITHIERLQILEALRLWQAQIYTGEIHFSKMTPDEIDGLCNRIKSMTNLYTLSCDGQRISSGAEITAASNAGLKRAMERYSFPGRKIVGWQVGYFSDCWVALRDQDTKLRATYMGVACSVEKPDHTKKKAVWKLTPIENVLVPIYESTEG